MEVEGAFSSCFPDFIEESSLEHKALSKKPLPCAEGGDEGAIEACFDCNICLDLAADPVVTLCGHLYCWPCIYRWFHLEATHNCLPLCPVCKSPFLESSLVPLYGRGLDARFHRRSNDIPDRPKDHQRLVAPTTTAPTNHQHQNYPFYDDGGGRSMGFLPALPILPWTSRNRPGFFSSSYQTLEAAGGNMGSIMRRRRQELREAIWLHQLWVFLFCCAVLCLVFF